MSNLLQISKLGKLVNISSDSESDSESDSDFDSDFDSESKSDTNSIIQNNATNIISKDIDQNATTNLKKSKTKTNIDIFKSKILGKSLNKTAKYNMREISVKKLVSLISEKIITIPYFQRSVDNTKVDQLLASFLLNNHIFNFVTNPLQIAYLIHQDCTNLMLIDGQHRYNMYKKLFDQNLIPNHQLLINIIICENIDEVVNLYHTLNYDNPNIIRLSTKMKSDAKILLLEQRYRALKNEFETNYKQCFKKNSKILFDSEEYVARLIDINFLDYFDTNDKAIKHILDMNDYYYQEYYNQLIKKYKNSLITRFDKEEIQLLSNLLNPNDKPYFFSFRNNNFLKSLACNDDEIDEFKFQHYTKILTNNKTKNAKKVVPNSNVTIVTNK